jgi:hypothetical protein
MLGGGKVLPASTEAGERRREVMRFLIREGRFPQILQSIMEDLQPEAAYFTDVDGARGGYFVVNGDDSSEMFSKTEALFQGMGAEIRIHLVWTAEDVQKGMPALEQAAQKYGDSE